MHTDHNHSIHQWKGLLRRQQIFKNLKNEEVLDIKFKYGQTPGTWSCLVFGGGVLLDNVEIEKPYQDILKQDLPFDFSGLGDLELFSGFRQLLFSARVHFESSFNKGLWVPDHRGLYARSCASREELAQMSKLHNLVSDSLRHFSEENNDRALAVLRQVSLLYRSVVQYGHHRQYSDILAILLLVRRAGHEDRYRDMKRDFINHAEAVLQPNDPRRTMFQALDRLEIDTDGHLYITFDTYCRSLWMSQMSKIGLDRIIAIYSYNQASFPRADAGGFYSTFKGLTREQILNILQRIDREFQVYSHETFTLWHTAIRSLWSESKFLEMSYFANILCRRINKLAIDFDCAQDKQLNLDASLTFYLLGQAYEALDHQGSALVSFEKSVHLREQVPAVDTVDTAKVAALRKSMSLASRLGDENRVMRGRESMERIYSAVEVV
ncbi:hypothetical protein ASPSYDRAFT_59325 [Aspergillus sydowii CBS 593.65]|uniref:Clr5 domain-containing protein n=1 Tax=Aspergillus sydowii CBS 593.65 TaxID=1036612 RepID=A0A1L9TBU4_9EURO|nr:uncharacterized protein ASPSYDRAFT_59325 [Aspergillus sydowii CBS 593.65]OJJ56855.1 hypothetical protein ASPSYDRAFT_59325 [Aspergillus sydowii CBS 593.65]